MTAPIASPPPELRPAPAGRAERLAAALLRLTLRTSFRALIGPPTPPALQRPLVRALALSMPGTRGTRRRRLLLSALAVEVVEPTAAAAPGVLLYLHGGAYMAGSPATHRAITTRLAVLIGCPVWVPDYRLAPEHPHPAALDDAWACWQALRAAGHDAARIVVAGDSAGAGLALALALRLRDQGQAGPAGLLLASPFVDPTLSGASLRERAAADPMLREGWLRQSVAACATPAAAHEFRPLAQPLAGLPPMLVQVGSDEILFDDARRLAERAAAAGVALRWQVWARRWHVFQLAAAWLSTARAALAEQAAQARAWLDRG